MTEPENMADENRAAEIASSLLAAKRWRPRILWSQTKDKNRRVKMTADEWLGFTAFTSEDADGDGPWWRTDPPHDAGTEWHAGWLAAQIVHGSISVLPLYGMYSDDDPSLASVLRHTATPKGV